MNFCFEPDRSRFCDPAAGGSLFNFADGLQVTFAP